MNAYAYIRVSGAEQRKGHGLRRQIQAIREYSKAKEITVVNVFRDIGVSGTVETLDRPRFGAMIVELNGVRDIIVERLDRLARDSMVQGHAITWLASHGVSIHAADSAQNVTEAYMADPMQRAIIQIIGVLAELDKRMTVKKLKLARKAIRDKGVKCDGRKRYGENSENRTPEQVAYDAETVRRIVALRESNHTQREK